VGGVFFLFSQPSSSTYASDDFHSGFDIYGDGDDDEREREREREKERKEVKKGRMGWQLP
jgi:hypothetical protein